MDKTISISLGGFSFIIDDRAFLKLKNYLDEIRRSLHGMEGTDDIIADVEIRIAELFKQKLVAREVVNELDVDYIVDVMGKPEQYMDSDEVEGSTSTSNFNSSSKSSTSSGDRVKKKLYRDPNDKIIGGVLSGLAHYFGIEPWITRVLWIVLFFSDAFISFTSFTFISYIVLWIILPKAETATQKYEMYGQAGDFETIKKNASQAASEIKGVARDASGVLGKIFEIIGKIILFMIGFVLIITGIGLIIGAISLIAAAITSAGIPYQFFGYIVDNDWQKNVCIVLLLLGTIIPGILLVILGAKCISSRVKVNRYFTIIALSIWVLSIIGAAIMAANIANNFTREIEFSEKKSFTVEADTISISFNKYNHSSKKIGKWIFKNDMDDFIEFDGKLHRQISDYIEIIPSENDQVSVEVLYYSKGPSMDSAREFAETIQYAYSMNANGELILDNYISIPEDSKFRDQSVKIVVYVPKNKIIHTKDVNDVKFYDIENDSYEYEYGKNKFYNFVEGQVNCLNCAEDESDESNDEEIRFEIGDDSTSIKVSQKGVEIKDKNDSVIIKPTKIKVKNGTDSIDIDVSGN